MSNGTRSETQAQIDDRIERLIEAAEQETWDTYVEPVSEEWVEEE